MMIKILVLMVGVFACSTAGILIRLSQEHALLLASYRLIIAAILLTPCMIRDMRKHGVRFTGRSVGPAIIGGAVMAAHFVTWIMGVRHTPVANASLIVNLIPIAMPFFLFVMLREKLTRQEWIGTLLAVGGLLLLGSSDLRISMSHLYGDVLCLASMLLFACYLAIGRKYNHFPTIWLYIVPLYYAAGLFCFVAALPFVNPIKPYGLQDLLPIFALALIPTIVGHTILNHAMKHLRGQIVSIMTSTQFLFAGVLSYFILDEIPALLFYPASVILLIAIWIVVSAHATQARSEA